jgi:predicted helicase
MKDVFENYLRSLRQDRDDKTEHSDRGALLTLLNVAADDAGPGIRIIHEAKKVAGSGAPDFKVMTAAMILGYVENKTIGENLDQVLKSDQIRRYKELSNNILLTDYLQFIWIKDGKVNGRENIVFPDDLEGRPKRPREDRVKAVSDLLRGFFSTAPEGSAESQKLALELAKRSHYLRDFLDSELRRQENEHAVERLYGLYQVFRDQVFHELALGEFADAFAQMLAYGLFLAKLNSNGEVITLANARQFVPGSFRLIRELVQFLDDLSAPEYVEIRWVVEEILSIVNGLDLHAIREDLSFKHRKAISRKARHDEEEHRLPFIYFYEDFLGKYDAKMKKARGVYYTPPPVVNFIVRAVDDILKESLGIAQGLADHKRVTVLDFACGTGTFLLEVFQCIFDNIGGPNSGRADLIVREHLLKNVFGFEYLIAPYTIAHLKLSQYLRDQNHPLENNERLQVFLTNTLEPVAPQANFLLPAISAEVKAAQEVKDRDILVIVGNPPYLGISKNMGAAAQGLIERYKYVDGDHFRERKHWLQDDYVKFIAFAQKKRDEVEEGIVGVISNRRFLENVTFRGMRQSLLRTFDQVFVLDLGGASDSTFENGPDENVFDIPLGVAITILAKTGASQRIRYRRVGGTRIQKYQSLTRETVENSSATEVQPTTPNYFFFPHSIQSNEGESFHSLREIYQVFGIGIITARDALTTAFTTEELASRIDRFAGLSVDEARREFGLGKDVQGWSIAKAQEEIKQTHADKHLIRRLNYRPFVNRVTYYTGKSNGFISRPTYEVMRHLLRYEIPSLVTCRLLTSESWAHGFVTDAIIDNCYLSNASRERAYAFPLYIESNHEPGQIQNFSSAFRTFIDSRYEHHYTPEEILGYIYAILYAPTYRTRYAEFLRIDFPRVPFPESADDFETLSGLGWALVQAHLLRELPRSGLAAYHGKGDHTVEAVRYSPEEQAVAINKTQCFKPVPQAVWDFHIGGYQVLDKYLKSRKDRELSLDEINHVSAIADSLTFTIEQMKRIDEAYQAAFPDGDNSKQSSHRPVH